MTALDGKTTGCLISRGDAPELFSQPLQIEVSLESGRKLLFTPGGPIREWRFLLDGRQIAISFNSANNQVSDALYDTQTGNLIDKVEQEPRDPTQLPQWAKDQAELDDESVPESDDLNAERTKWIARVMRQIQAIHPGMKRKDLDEFFTTEGGLSWRTQEVYVSIECPYIKVTVHFNPTDEIPKDGRYDPEDVIKSVSEPYLQWAIMD